MITENLYKNILIDPAINGGDELFIVSGYSSATFLRRHINELKDINKDLKINLMFALLIIIMMELLMIFYYKIYSMKQIQIVNILILKIRIYLKVMNHT